MTATILPFPGFSTRMPFPLVWDNTMRSEFADCPRRFFYRFIHNLLPAHSSKIDLVAGGAYARGLEVYRLHFYSDGEKKGDVVHATSRGAEALIKEYGTTVCPPENPKSLERMVEALGSYVMQYPPARDNFKPMLIAGKPAVEFNFSAPIPEVLHPETGEPIIYCGRFDALVQQDGITSECWVDDEKTTKAMGFTWAEQWRWRSQFMGYVWGARQFGHPAVGALVRGVAVQKTQIKHAQALVSIPQWKIDAWYAQLVRDLNRAIQSWKDMYFDYNMASKCSTYGGCGYISLCDTPEPDRWVEPAFRVDAWDPLRLNKVDE